MTELDKWQVILRSKALHGGLILTEEMCIQLADAITPALEDQRKFMTLRSTLTDANRLILGEFAQKILSLSGNLHFATGESCLYSL